MMLAVAVTDHLFGAGASLFGCPPLLVASSMPPHLPLVPHLHQPNHMGVHPRTRISYLKQLTPDVRPFDHGPINNILLICCVPMLIDWSHPHHWTTENYYT